MENRSITQSAEELGLSPAKASRNLARLRLIFQDPLFVRTRHGMVPTAKAQELFPALVNSIYQLECLCSPQEKRVEDFNSLVKIAAVDNGVMMFISQIVEKAFKRAPDLKIDISPLNADLYERIESGSVDMAIYPDTPLPADFHEATLYEDYFVCVVHKEHPLANYAKINKIPPVEEINRYKKVEVVVRGSQNQALDDQVYENQYQAASISTPYFFSTPSLLENREFTTILAYTTARALSQCAPIVILPAPKPYKTYRARLIWHHRTHHDPVLKWVRQLIVKSARTSPYMPNLT